MNFGEIRVMVPETSALRTVSVRGRTVPWLVTSKFADIASSSSTSTSGARLTRSFLGGSGFIFTIANAMKTAAPRMAAITMKRFKIRVPSVSWPVCDQERVF